MGKESKLTQSTIMEWVYDKAINGIQELDAAYEHADNYIQGNGTLRKKLTA